MLPARSIRSRPPCAVPNRQVWNNDFCELERRFYQDGLGIKDALNGAYFDIAIVEPGIGAEAQLDNTGLTFLAGTTPTQRHMPRSLPWVLGY